MLRTLILVAITLLGFLPTCVLTIMTMGTDWDKQVSVSQGRLNRWVEPESRGQNQTSPRV
ncbi:unnamed protein product [Eruca vesicaria subsp. sativa]|uniref:Uncharacterized protein n=1 Tax=Eruca vesicaria subsp. sativa TaxID=29727 RepID=A0ABC8LFB2_ERUVS|nr:unnamed protein product [Eruca vesicaria subsp. sativa]